MPFPNPTHSQKKDSLPAGEHDPFITPWPEEEKANEKERHSMQPIKRGKSWREWLVLLAAFLLAIYVIAFLALGMQETSDTSFGAFASSGTIAIIPLRGEISAERNDLGAYYQDIVDALKEADEDTSINAILLDIESPGGGVVSTKQIVYQLQQTKKPVVSWIGEVGASGAYYAAAATDFIMADNDSITGSIGVISFQPNVQGLLEKLGIQVETIQAGELKTIGSPFKELTEEEKEILQGIVNQVYGHFKRDIIVFRREKELDLNRFEEISDGRILTGWQAKDIGLIDAIGSREEAIQKTAELGGITGKPRIRIIERKEFSLRELLFGLGTQFGKGISAGVRAETTATATSPESPIRIV